MAFETPPRFVEPDLLVKYETIIKYWPVDTIYIVVNRLTGPLLQHLITDRPNSGAALYEALAKIHGQHEEAEYEIKFVSSGKYRGVGRIRMPRTLHNELNG